MAGIALVGDHAPGVCRAGHSDVVKGHNKNMITTFVTGSESVFINGVACVTVDSLGDTDCGHHTKATTGAPTVFIGGKPAHIIGSGGVVIEDGGGEYTVQQVSDSV